MGMAKFGYCMLVLLCQSAAQHDLLDETVKTCDPSTTLGCTHDDEFKAEFTAFEKPTVIELEETYEQTLDDRHISGQSRPRERECPLHTHDCVLYYQCIDGEINFTGENLIDIRTRPLRECTDPENPNIPGVCCRFPGVSTTPKSLEECPSGLVCVEQEQCNLDGTVNTDGSGLIDQRVHKNLQVCLLYPNSHETGVCCELLSPPPLDTCPDYQVCVPEQLCTTALDVDNLCFIDKPSYVTGICCDAPVIDCPQDSVCIPEYECRGEILTTERKFAPVNEGNGIWAQCILDAHETGVCCQYSAPCGIRNYGRGGRARAPLAKNLAIFGEFPWQAIIFFSNFTYKCGASLVGGQWIITGAHCVNGHRYSDLQVRLGEWQVNSDAESLPHVDVNISSIYIHPKFNNRSLQNNLAIVELNIPVEYNFHINTICLPSYGKVLHSGTRCIATGWGKDAFEGSFQVILHKVDVPFVEHEHCQALLRKTRLGQHFRLHESFSCFGGEENKDACTGDGGGPLACKDLSTGQYFLHGITSWGIGCGRKDVPGVYADVQFFDEWIKGIIRT